MGNLLTSLYDYKVKKHALIAAAIFFIIDKIIYLLESYYEYIFIHHIFLNYLVVFSLLMAASSKDKVDDERSLLIRYSVLKQSLSLFVLVFGIIAMFSNIFHVESLSMLTILYCIQGLLAVHIVLVYLGNKYNPSWLFKEKTAPDNYNKMMIGLFYGFYAIAALLIGLSFFIKH